MSINLDQCQDIFWERRVDSVIPEGEVVPTEYFSMQDGQLPIFSFDINLPKDTIQSCKDDK